MHAQQLEIQGAWSIALQRHGDARGFFSEWFRCEFASTLLGQPWNTAQANVSRSARGVVRGIHYALLPPGQAKWVTCMDGSITDFVVDIRPDSPTFGQYATVRLDATEGTAVLLSEGLGHAFRVDSDFATIAYLVNQPYNPERELGIDPLDPTIRLPLEVDAVLLSSKDAQAPTLAEARDALVLPTLHQMEALRTEWNSAS